MPVTPEGLSSTFRLNAHAHDLSVPRDQAIELLRKAIVVRGVLSLWNAAGELLQNQHLIGSNDRDWVHLRRGRADRWTIEFQDNHLHRNANRADTENRWTYSGAVKEMKDSEIAQYRYPSLQDAIERLDRWHNNRLGLAKVMAPSNWPPLSASEPDELVRRATVFDAGGEPVVNGRRILNPDDAPLYQRMRIELRGRDPSKSYWTVIAGGCCISKSTLERVEESLPSSRTDSFIRDTRVRGLLDAFDLAERYKKHVLRGAKRLPVFRIETD